MSFYVYIVASGRNGTIYIGSTDNLSKRIWEHKTKARGDSHRGASRSCASRPAT